MTVRPTRQTGPRKKPKTQKGGNLLGTIASLDKKGLSACDEAINPDIGKKLVDKGIKHAPELYCLGMSKIKNKNASKALESEVANYVVQEAQRKAAENVENLSG